MAADVNRARNTPVRAAKAPARASITTAKPCEPSAVVMGAAATTIGVLRPEGLITGRRTALPGSEPPSRSASTRRSSRYVPLSGMVPALATRVDPLKIAMPAPFGSSRRSARSRAVITFSPVSTTGRESLTP